MIVTTSLKQQTNSKNRLGWHQKQPRKESSANNREIKPRNIAD